VTIVSTVVVVRVSFLKILLTEIITIQFISFILLNFISPVFRQLESSSDLVNTSESIRDIPPEILIGVMSSQVDSLLKMKV
jgi:hypothetical protein